MIVWFARTLRWTREQTMSHSFRDLLLIQGSYVKKPDDDDFE